MTSRGPILLSALLILAMLAAGLWTLSAIPEGATVPLHFGPDGRPDRFGDPVVGLLTLPAIAAALAVLLSAVVPRIEPRPGSIPASSRAIGHVLVATVALLAAVQAVIVGHALGRPVDAGMVVLAATGVLLVVIGNVLGKMRPNFFIGIRTPWTLSDDRVWDKTHRFGGRVFVACGALLVAVALALPADGPRMAAVLAVIVAAVALPIGKSYLLWRDRPGSAN